MLTTFKAIALKKTEKTASWTVVLTTPEGDHHEIPGFETETDARYWAQRETGQAPSEILLQRS
jgi:hypothetical protein